MSLFSPDLPDAPEMFFVYSTNARYLEGKIGDVEIKHRLVEVLNAYLAPLRERRAEYIAQPKMLLEVLFSGTVRAKFIAQETLEEVHQKMGLLHSQSFSEKVLANNISGIFC